MYEVRDIVIQYPFLLWRCLSINNKEVLINEEIRDKEVRVVGDDGSQLGIMQTKDALKLSIEKNLDLVKIAPQATPPVCRIMDYGKFCFEQSKREKEAKKNQHVTNVKEVQLSFKIDTHDFNTKLNHAIRFLKDGDKVKVVMKLKGREMSHASMGEATMVNFANGAQEYGVYDKQPQLVGRNIIMFLAPKLPK